MTSQDYYQFAYVTTDWAQAKAELAAQHDISGWYEMANAEFDTGENRTAVCHFALAFKSDLQFEIIQPISGDDSVYRQGLPDTGYAKRFHHLGRHFGDRAAFDRQLATAKARYAMPVASDTMGGTYAYFDARGETGHFLEYFCFPPNSHLADVPRF